MSLQDKRQAILSRGLCHGCLAWGHIRRDCRNKKACSTCNGLHPTLLHDDAFVTKKEDQTKPVAEAISRCVEASKSRKHSQCFSHSLILPVWLSHEDHPDVKVLTYALLDDQSDACFVRRTVMDKLAVKGHKVQLKLSTGLAEKVVTCEKILKWTDCSRLQGRNQHSPSSDTHEETFQPAKDRSQDQRQPATGPTLHELQICSCPSEKIWRLE